MSLSDLSIKKPVFAWMLMLGLIVFGSISFKKMGVSQLPDIDFPVVTIGLSLDGAAPEIMESDIVDPLEDALTSVQGISGISSSSKSGSATIVLEFQLEKNIDVAVQEVQSLLGQMSRRLPKEMDPPSVRKTNPEDQPIVWISVSSSSLSSVQLMTLVRDRIKDQFSTIEGVGDITLGGYVDPALRVWLSSQQMSKYSLTAMDILGTIRAEHSELPSGRIESKEKEFNIRTLGEAPSPKEFGDIYVTKRGGAPNFAQIHLNQVARIEEGLSDVRRISRSNGQFAIGLGIKKQRGANAVSVAELIRKKLSSIQTDLPKDVQAQVRFDTTRFISESVHELNFTLILSALLTALVCWMFLGSWSATLNVILAIPTSVIGTFIILSALGFTLNTFTLLGLSLAIGIVVDDAIMVLENIVRHQEMGQSRLEAAHRGANEISFAALVSTVAVVAIFLPVAFMSGMMGRFFFQFGVTISVAVSLSLLEALTLTPMRCSRYLNMTPRTSRFGKSIESAFVWSEMQYRQKLKGFLNHPFKTIFASVLIFAFSFFLLQKLPKEFVPPQDQGRLMMRFLTPPGTSLEITDQKFLEIEKVLKNIPEIKDYFGSIGAGGPGGGDVNTGFLFLTLNPKDTRRINPESKNRYTTQELMPLIRKETKEIKDVRITLQDPSLSGFAGGSRGYPIEFTIKGANWTVLTKLSEKVVQDLRAKDFVSDVESDYQAGLPEVRVIPDREKARMRGVSVTDIGETINAAIGGVIAGKFSKDGKRHDVRVRLEATERSQNSDILKLQVRNYRGELIPLSEVVTLSEGKTVQSINRNDRERAISIHANVGKGFVQQKAMDLVEGVVRPTLPEGYRLIKTGNTKSFQQGFSSLWIALILGLLISYMVLASQFNSFIDPITVLVALPFSITGAFFALYVSGQSLNIYSMIGILLLLGIVKKNSIILVDFANQVRDRDEFKDKNIKDILLYACPVRLRPVLMTSIATVVGALPAALALGPGAESRIPMAIAIIGGVIVSTVLTLIVVPCIYQSFNQGFQTFKT